MEIMMTVETKANLRDETITKLQDLIQLNIDSQKGFWQAAETIKDPTVAALFRRIASVRADNAAELKAHVAFNHEKPREDGSMLGTMHRWWLSARGALVGGDDHVVLSEAERGEDAIKQKYEEVLRELPGTAMNDVIIHQYARVKDQHERIRDLRDERAIH
ncbi:MAG: PA2169 family four-helix-bundle protein [Phycisphaerae bacterium]|nr:PA2169 family four-helix-bundle protein [Phycisphaerae bacterium]